MHPRGKADTDRCPIGFTEAMELWLGPSPNGSAFNSREELIGAWQRGREYVMRLWGCHGRRPQAWWAFETDLPYPGYARERSVLWRAAGVLTEAERAELECEWKAAFQEAQPDGFMLNDGSGELLRGDCARAAHYEHHDIPRELLKRWAAAARRRRSRMTPEKAPDVVVEGKAEEFTGIQPESNATAEALK
jgi:hypothetical protein